eukprot:TRINITY_DN1648_c4_g1_i1.p1 TRINITY_DN1648_c4_g1~~TRINITY_DN1648_c4_g1_i1.p1  ORF type:complete len:572 (-),score=191.34 TRINITY_DN1648_c4_g1_i1:16-1731(-)
MQYLLQFAVSHELFRCEEVDAILVRAGVDPATAYDVGAARKAFDLGSPFLICDLPSEAVARQLSEKAILVKRVLELWGTAATLEQTVEAVKAFPEERLRPHLAEDRSWSVAVAGVRCKRSSEEQQEIRKHFAFLPLLGPVRCKEPDTALYCLEEFAAEGYFEEGRMPLRVYFGREVGQSNRRLVGARSLSTRAYLGPTSMDNELSLVMANMVHAGPGTLILDPFVGTGSILVAAAQFGAVCIGTDIDPRPLHGRGDGANIFSNFDQFGLPHPDVVRSDNALFAGHFKGGIVDGLFDGIVTDPPYGIRAGARRTGSRRANVTPVRPEQRADHVPMTRPYAVEDVLVDLLDVAARALRRGRRLCYLMPGTYETCTRESLPGHLCLRLVAHSVQGLTKTTCRRLVTMVKVADYDPTQRAAYEAHSRRGLTAAEVDPRAAVPERPTEEWKQSLLRRGKLGGTSWVPAGDTAAAMAQAAAAAAADAAGGGGEGDTAAAMAQAAASADAAAGGGGEGGSGALPAAADAAGGGGGGEGGSGALNGAGDGAAALPPPPPQEESVSADAETTAACAGVHQ